MNKLRLFKVAHIVLVGIYYIEGDTQWVVKQDIAKFVIVTRSRKMSRMSKIINFEFLDYILAA